MDFTFPREYDLLRRMIREFARNEVAPLAKKVDAEHYVPMETVRKAAALGLMGIPFPQEYGGVGAGELGYCILMEELGRVCTSTAAVIGAHIGISAMAVYLDGTPEQKERYLVPLARGEKLGAFALTEANAGSDAAAIRTRAIRDGDEFVLSGTKMFITNGPQADIVIVMAVTDPTLGARGGITAFLVEMDWPGCSVGSIENKMGIRGSGTSELVFDEVRVPKENVLGQFGAGFITFMKSLDLGRVSLGAACLGSAQAALDLSVKWSAARTQFGRIVAQNQSVHWMIADMATEIEALRSLVYRTTWMVDTGQEFSRHAAMCKLFGSEVASRAISKAVQIFGALGYSRDVGIERMFRDARISEIFEGTNEIQRIVIASDIFRPEGVRIGA